MMELFEILHCYSFDKSITVYLCIIPNKIPQGYIVRTIWSPSKSSNLPKFLQGAG